MMRRIIIIASLIGATFVVPTLAAHADPHDQCAEPAAGGLPTVAAQADTSDTPVDNGGGSDGDETEVGTYDEQTSDAVVGVCVDTGGQAFSGGSVEAGTSREIVPDDEGEPDDNFCGPDQDYLVLDGDNDNTAGGASDGYVGLSNCENGAKDGTDADGCDATHESTEDGAGSSNSGTCFGIDQADPADPDCVPDPDDPDCGRVWVIGPVNFADLDDDAGNGLFPGNHPPTPVCGDDSGESWHSSNRDGCRQGT